MILLAACLTAIREVSACCIVVFLFFVLKRPGMYTVSFADTNMQHEHPLFQKKGGR